jgi:hypothetical protein
MRSPEDAKKEAALTSWNIIKMYGTENHPKPAKTQNWSKWWRNLYGNKHDVTTMRSSKGAKSSTDTMYHHKKSTVSKTKTKSRPQHGTGEIVMTIQGSYWPESKNVMKNERLWLVRSEHVWSVTSQQWRHSTHLCCPRHFFQAFFRFWSAPLGSSEPTATALKVSAFYTRQNRTHTPTHPLTPRP